MKKLLAFMLVTLLFVLGGCSKAGAASSSTAQVDPDYGVEFGYPDEQLSEEDMAIPDVALEWQKRNAPIYFDENFFEKYSHSGAEYDYVDLDTALNSVEIDVKYDAITHAITIRPMQELGPIMFQFTLNCVDLEDPQVCIVYEYLYEFMHTNSNHEDWLCYFSESEPPNEETVFFSVYIAGKEFMLTENVLMEIDTTIATMLQIGNDDLHFDYLEPIESPTFTA